MQSASPPTPPTPPTNAGCFMRWVQCDCIWRGIFLSPTRLESATREGYELNSWDLKSRQLRQLPQIQKASWRCLASVLRSVWRMPNTSRELVHRCSIRPARQMRAIENTPFFSSLKCWIISWGSEWYELKCRCLFSVSASIICTALIMQPQPLSLPSASMSFRYVNQKVLRYQNQNRQPCSESQDFPRSQSVESSLRMQIYLRMITGRRQSVFLAVQAKLVFSSDTACRVDLQADVRDPQSSFEVLRNESAKEYGSSMRDSFSYSLAH